MQHATTARGAQQPVQQPRNATAAIPYETGAPALQQSMQQARNGRATPEAANAAEVLHAATPKAAFRWRVAYRNGVAMELLFHPAATRAEVAELYPGASIAPLPDTPTRAATSAEADELRRTIDAILVNHTDANRAEALAVALADSDAALACYRALTAIR